MTCSDGVGSRECERAEGIDVGEVDLQRRAGIITVGRLTHQLLRRGPPRPAETREAARRGGQETSEADHAGSFSRVGDIDE